MSTNDLEEEFDEEAIYSRRTCCPAWRFIFFSCSGVSGILALIVAGVCIHGLASTVPPMPLVAREVYATALAISLVGLCLCTCCAMSVYVTNRGCSICFLLSGLLFSLVELVFFIYLLMYLTNDDSVLLFQDLIATQRQSAIDNLLAVAENDPLTWRVTQDVFRCCGFDFEAGCNGTLEVSQLETGGVCEAQQTNLESNRTAFCGSEAGILAVTTFNPDFNTAALFFCADVFENEMRQAAVAISSVTFAFVFTTYVSAFAALKLMWIPVERRGLLRRGYGRYPSSDTESALTNRNGTLSDLDEVQIREQLADTVARRLRESGEEIRRIRGNIRRRFGTLGDGVVRRWTQSTGRTGTETATQTTQYTEEKRTEGIRGDDTFEYELNRSGTRGRRDTDEDGGGEFEEHIQSPVEPRRSPSMYERLRRGLPGRLIPRSSGHSSETQESRYQERGVVGRLSQHLPGRLNFSGFMRPYPPAAPPRGYIPPHQPQGAPLPPVPPPPRPFMGVFFYSPAHGRASQTSSNQRQNGQQRSYHGHPSQQY